MGTNCAPLLADILLFIWGRICSETVTG
jgi:hypothetical protein